MTQRNFVNQSEVQARFLLRSRLWVVSCFPVKEVAPLPVLPAAFDYASGIDHIDWPSESGSFDLFLRWTGCLKATDTGFNEPVVRCCGLG